MDKKVPLRQCVACREMKPKKDLVRVIRTSEGEYLVDFTGKLNGRGAYICNNVECMDKCVKSKSLSKSFKENISQDVYTKLKEDFISGNK